MSRTHSSNPGFAPNRIDMSIMIRTQSCVMAAYLVQTMHAGLILNHGGTVQSLYMVMLVPCVGVSSGTTRSCWLVLSLLVSGIRYNYKAADSPFQLKWGCRTCTLPLTIKKTHTQRSVLVNSNNWTHWQATCSHILPIYQYIHFVLFTY